MATNVPEALATLKSEIRAKVAEAVERFTAETGLEPHAIRIDFPETTSMTDRYRRHGLMGTIDVKFSL